MIPALITSTVVGAGFQPALPVVDDAPRGYLPFTPPVCIVRFGRLPGTKKGQVRNLPLRARDGAPNTVGAGFEPAGALVELSRFLRPDHYGMCFRCDSPDWFYQEHGRLKTGAYARRIGPANDVPATIALSLTLSHAWERVLFPLRVPQQHLGQFLGVLGHYLVAGLDLHCFHALKPLGDAGLGVGRDHLVLGKYDVGHRAGQLHGIHG